MSEEQPFTELLTFAMFALQGLCTTPDEQKRLGEIASTERSTDELHATTGTPVDHRIRPVYKSRKPRKRRRNLISVVPRRCRALLLTALVVPLN